MAVAKNVLGYIEQRDLRLMRRMNRWQAPRWVRICMLVMTKLGDGLLWYALALIVLVFGGQRGIHAFIAGAFGAFSAIALFKQVKRISRRPRPCQLEPHCWAMVAPPDQFSFPSGHSMTSFAIAISLGHFYPEFLQVLLLAALCVAVSRIVMGMHFLTDVVVGVMLGIGLGLLSVRLLG
jgi:undecaprenyl-diphosphatase